MAGIPLVLNPEYGSAAGVFYQRKIYAEASDEIHQSHRFELWGCGCRPEPEGIHEQIPVLRPRLQLQAVAGLAIPRLEVELRPIGRYQFHGIGFAVEDYRIAGL